jgi:PAS domain S-box-containing protein
MIENSCAKQKHGEAARPMATERARAELTTRLQAAEAALRESEERFFNTIEAAPDSITISRMKDGRFLLVNQYFCDLTGYTREEALGRSSLELGLFVSGSDRQRYLEILSENGEVKNFEIRFRRKNGALFDALLSARPLSYLGQDCLIVIVSDISNLKKVERERALMAAVVQQANESIIVTDRRGSILYVNPAFEQTSGFDQRELLGRNFRKLKSDEHDGSFYQKMWQTISSGEVWSGNIINRMKDGKLCEFETTISPIRDSKGRITNFVSVNRDVSHEVTLQSQLRQAQKMEAIGTLAGGIAHDFNNILSAIMGYTELSMMDALPDSRIRNNLKEIYQASTRAREMVKQILTFSRQSEQERRPIQVTPIIKEALKMLRASLPTTIDIRQNIDREIGIIEADATQIQQLLMNLCTNAAHAMRETGGVLEVQLTNVASNPALTEQMPDLKIGPYLKLSITDTGHGIHPGDKERIFDPYFTTKEKGEGTGLGLAVVQGIVKSHEGGIMVESTIGKGSAFHVYLPRIENKMPVDDAPASPLPTGRERILFVDDEKTLVEIGKQMLERLGYKVETRTSSVEALKLFQADPARFDLIITDMTMPNMTGEKLALEIIKIRPDVPVVLCSGYSNLIAENIAREIGIRAFVMKPLVLQDLATTIRRVLDRQAGTRS